MTTIGSGHHHLPSSSAANALSGMGPRSSRASQTGAMAEPPAFPELDAASTSANTAASTSLADGGFGPSEGMGCGPGLPPSDDGQNNGFSQMGMDTQSFAMMMGGGMPPPPPPMGRIGTDDGEMVPIESLDSNQDGSLSTAELNSFKDKLDNLFSQMQEMGGNAFGMTPPTLDITA